MYTIQNLLDNILIYMAYNHPHSSDYSQKRIEKHLPIFSLSFTIRIMICKERKTNETTFTGGVNTI